MGEEWPFISDVESIQAHYQECRKNGCSHTLAEMLATRSFPGTKGTDRAFMEGRHLDGSQFEHLPRWMGEEYIAKALAAGVNPTGKWYSGPLARFPGDPRAWVDSVGDVRRIAAERGLEVSGAVECSPPRYAENAPATGPYRVAPDIVEDKVIDLLDEQPELAHAVRREDLVHEMTERLSGRGRDYDQEAMGAGAGG